MATKSSDLPWSRLATEPEQDFVLLLARAYAVDEAPEITLEALLTVVPGVTSWQRVTTLLRAHRCTALAYAVLRAPVIREADLVPPMVLTPIRERYSASFTRTVLEPPMLHRVLDTMQEKAISVMAIKGLAIGTWLYGDAALREHDDIDLLVPAADAGRADAALAELGYRSGYRPPLYPGESPATAGYLADDNRIPIDLSFDPLHVFWQVPRERLASFEGWWLRRQEVAIGGRPVCMPGPEDQCLQLARHLQYHGYFRANWWVDVMLLLHRYGPSLDWDLIGREAERHGIKGGVYRTLELVESTYGLPLPRRTRERLYPGWVVGALHRRVWPDRLAVPRERPLREQEGTPIAPRFLSPGGVHPIAGLSLFVLDRKRSRYLQYLIQRVVPPLSWLRANYGPGGYVGLLRRHWSALRELRRFVRQTTK